MTERGEMIAKLFSYGTLQLQSVQPATLGRTLEGVQDSLVGHSLSTLAVKDPSVVATSGEASHPIIRATRDPADIVHGTVFEVTARELQNADVYEVDDYRHVRVALESGERAWVYVAADSP